MIEADIITILEADTTLDTLLGSSASDSRIYPLKVPQMGTGETYGTPPYIVYSCSIGSEDEILDEDRLEFTVVATTMLKMQNIKYRMKTLLDKQDGIQPVTSNNYWIYYSKLVGGGDDIQVDLGYYLTTMIFAIKYKKKS